MSTNLEERVSTLEKELTDLKKFVLGKPIEKNWQKTVGMSSDDPGFDEMIQLVVQRTLHDF